MQTEAGSTDWQKQWLSASCALQSWSSGLSYSLVATSGTIASDRLPP